MKRHIVYGVLLAFLLTASAWTSPRRYLTRPVVAGPVVAGPVVAGPDFYDDDVDDDVQQLTTSCLNYCTSRLTGTSYCCPTAAGTTYQNAGGNLVQCGPHSVNCELQRPPYTTVVNQPTATVHRPVVYRQPQVAVCDSPCLASPNPLPPYYECPPTRCNPVPVTTPPPVIYDQPAPPKYECPRCNPAVPVPTWPRCVNRPCDPLSNAPLPPLALPPFPRPHLAGPSRICSIRGCRYPPNVCAEHLVVAIENLVNRSYAKSYSLETFIVGLQTILANHRSYSWFGECVQLHTPVVRVIPDPTPLSPEYDDEYEDVDTFDGPGTRTTACHPCSATPDGTRRCSTQFQTILGACDNCCRTSASRKRRDVAVGHQTVVRNPRDLREEVSKLVDRAPRMTRRAFLYVLSDIVSGALDGRYSWRQTEVAQTSRPQTASTTPRSTTSGSAETENRTDSPEYDP